MSFAGPLFGIAIVLAFTSVDASAESQTADIQAPRVYMPPEHYAAAAHIERRGGNALITDQVEFSILNTENFRWAYGLPNTGYVFQVEFKSKRLSEEDLQRISVLSTVRMLVLRDCILPESGLATLSGLRGLTGVDLSGTNITEDDLRHLKGNAHLKAIRFARTSISPTLVELCRRFPELHAIDCSETPVTDEDLSHGPNELVSLQSLALDGTAITDAGIALLSNHKLKQLQRLSLFGTKISGESIPHLCKLKTLENLRLPEDVLRDDGLRQLCRTLPDCAFW